MSDPVQLVAIITPKPGKMDEVISLLEPYNQFIEANQPDTLQYEMFKQVDGDAEVLVYIELFKDMAARELHRNTDEHKALLRKAAETGLLACPPDVKTLMPIGGFRSRK